MRLSVKAEPPKAVKSIWMTRCSTRPAHLQRAWLPPALHGGAGRNQRSVHSSGNPACAPAPAPLRNPARLITKPLHFHIVEDSLTSRHIAHRILCNCTCMRTGSWSRSIQSARLLADSWPVREKTALRICQPDAVRHYLHGPDIIRLIAQHKLYFIVLVQRSQIAPQISFRFADAGVLISSIFITRLSTALTSSAPLVSSDTR